MNTRNQTKILFAVAALAMLGVFLASPARAAIYTDGFNAASANQNNTQHDTTLALQYDPASSTTYYDNWTSSVFAQGHSVDLNPDNATLITGSPENLPNPNNWAAMLLFGQVLTSDANIAANTSGQEYTVSFLAGPAGYGPGQYSQRSQAAQSNGLRIEVIDNNGAGAVIGTTDFTDVDFDTNASALDLGLSNDSFNYTGSGNSDVKLRITGLGTGVFQGSIDTISIDVVPEPSSFALCALGLLSLGLIGRRKRR